MAAEDDPQQRRSMLPERPIERITGPLSSFLHVQSASGIVLAVCTVTALVAANSPWAADYARFWDQTLRIGVGAFELEYPLWYWINDALMAIFFFVIGLEIKREIVMGELSERARVILPVAAAIGGVAAPVGIYLYLQPGGAGADGWAIPMATDIAFVVGCLALLGSRVPHGLKILMLSLAIVDDILGVVVIAIFYTDSISLVLALAVVLGLVVTVVMNRLGVRSVPVYGLVGAVVWLCALKSGIHPTIAGVLLGLLTPTSAWLGDAPFVELLGRGKEVLDPSSKEGEAARRAILGDLAFASREAVSPLERIEAALHPWVAFGIMPVFALANAAVPVSLSSLGDPLAVAVAAGLFVGKPVGIVIASLLVVKLGLAQLPTGVRWPAVVGAACLGGIGFTMAMFIAGLGLAGEPLVSAKAGILLGSGASLLLGMGILALVLRRRG